MLKKSFPLFRVLFIILTLVLGQFQSVWALAEPQAGAEPITRHEIPLRQSPNAYECKTSVGIRWVNPATIPTPADDPDWYAPAPSFLGATVVEQIQPGQTLTAWLVIRNASADPYNPARPACNTTAGVGGPAELVKDIQPIVYINGSIQAASTFLDPIDTTLENYNDYTYTRIEFEVPANADPTYTIGVELHATSVDFDDSEEHAIVDVDVLTNKPGMVATVVGPSFVQQSFAPDMAGPPYTLPPGERVDYILTISNPRADNITDVQVPTGEQVLISSCTGIGKWRLTTAPDTPITQLAFGEQAFCRIPNVLIPSGGAESYTMEGTMTVTGASTLVYGPVPVIASRVEIEAPGIGVTKEVTEIIRNSVPVEPPAMPGDRITYLITVINTGETALEAISVTDSLTGMIYIPSDVTIGVGGSLPIDTAGYTVRADSPDPLTNRVSVSGQGVGTHRVVNADASASVDLVDSALTVTLEVFDAGDNPIQTATVGQTVTYELTIQNTGSTRLTNVRWREPEAAPYPLRLVGFDQETDTLQNSLVNGERITLRRTYIIGDDADPLTPEGDDPLTNTARIQATTITNQMIYGQDQVTLDIINPDIEIRAAVIDPPNPSSLLRGTTVSYQVTVLNKGPAPICNVRVDQLKRNPDTGAEVPVVIGLPLYWTGAAGRIEIGGEIDGPPITYAITGADRDPLHMIFKVSAVSSCDTPTEQLSDRTSISLGISDAHVNVTLQADLGLDDVAEVGDDVKFTLTAYNVGPVTLSELSAEYCLPDRLPTELWACDGEHQVPFPLSLDEILTLDQPAIGQFTYRIMERDLNPDPFIVQATLYGTDNKGKRVSITVGLVVPVATQKLRLKLTGPQEDVIGDTEPFNFTLTNESGIRLKDVRLFNMLISDDPDPIYGVPNQEVFATADILAGAPPVTGSFDYLIEPNVGFVGTDVLRMRVRAYATTDTTEEHVAVVSATADVLIIPILTVTKTGPGAVIAGQRVDYLVTIQNESDEQNVTITGYQDDVLDGYGIGITDGSFENWDPSPGILGPEVMISSVSGALSILAVNAIPTPLTNHFYVSGIRDYGNAEVFGVDDHIVDIACPIQFDVRVFNTDDEPDDILGESLEWTIEYTNISMDTLEDVTIIDTLQYEGQPIPGHQGMTLAPDAGGIIPPLRAIQITNDFYGPGWNDDQMTDTVTATFEQVAGTKDCKLTVPWPVYSPIGIDKFADLSVAFTGEVVTYGFVLYSRAEENDGIYSHYYVTVEDEMFGGNVPMQYNGASNPASPSGDMGPEEETPVTVRTHIIAEQDPDVLRNVAYASFPDPAEPEVTLVTADDWEVFTGSPLLLTKTPNPDTLVVPGQIVNYTYTLTNATKYYISNLTFADDKVGPLIPGLVPDDSINLEPYQVYAPDELKNVPYLVKASDDDPLINTAEATYDLTIPEEPIREDLKATIQAQVDLKDSDVTIEKTVHYTTPEPTPDNAIVPELGQSVIQIEANQNIRFCFTVENKSDPLAPSYRNITIVDTVLGNNDVQVAFEAALVVLPVHDPARGPAELFGGESVFFCTAGMLAQDLDDPHENTVILDGERTDAPDLKAHDEDTLSIDILGSIVRITKTTPQISYVVGETIEYTLKISNIAQSGVDITDVHVTDTRQGGVAVNLDDCFFPDGEERTLINGGAGKECTISYVVQPTDPDPLINDAHVTGFISNPDPEEVEDSTRSAVAVTESPLRVTKDVTLPVANPGDQITYYLTVTNIGQREVFDVHGEDSRYDDYNLPGTPETLDAVIQELVDNQGYDRDLTSINETLPPTYDLIMPDEAALLADHTLDPFVNTARFYGTIPTDAGGSIQVESSADAAVDILMPGVRISMQPEYLAAAPGQNMNYNVIITNIGGLTETLHHLMFDDGVNPVWNLDDLCTNEPAQCMFRYGPEPFNDETGLSNPKNGLIYDPSQGLAQHEQLFGTITVPVPEDIDTNEFTNFVEIQGQTIAVDPDVPKDVWDRTSATIDIRSDGINVEKTASLASAPIGATVHYTITVTNVGTPGATTEQRSAIEQLIFTDPGIAGETHTFIYSGPFADSPEDVIPGDDSATLDPDESYPYPYDYVLTATDADPYVNHASVVAVTTRGGTVMNTAQAIVDIETAEVAIDKYVCTEYMDPLPPNLATCTNVVNVGDAVTPDTVYYYLHIYNPSVVTIEGITISDPMVPGLDESDITWPGAPNVLAPNNEAEGGPDEVWYRYPYDVQPNSTDPLVNVVTVTANTGAGSGLADTASATLNLVTSNLQLTKTANVTQAQLGDTVEYLLTVRNLNTASAITNVMITDPLYDSTALCGPLTLDAATPELSCPFTHEVSTDDPSPLVNTARATGTQDSLTVSDTASLTLPIVTPGLLVTKTAYPPVASIGTVVTYTYVIENTSPDTVLSNLIVDDNDPLLSAFSEPWPAYLGVGQTATRTATHTITDQDVDPLTNTVTVTGMFGTDPVMAEVTETVVIANGELVVSNTPNRTYVRAGEQVIFTYNVQNVGASTLTGVQLTDNICNSALPLALGDILPGASASFDCVIVTAELPGPIISTAYAEGLFEGVPVNDTATAEVLVIPADGALLVEKTATPFVVEPGDTITYEVRVTNVGEESLTNFVVDDPTVSGLLPAPMPTFVLQVGESFVMHAALPAPDQDSITNTVTVTATGVLTNTIYEASDSATVAIVPDIAAAGLVITKQPDVQRVALGGTITYNFMIQNVGTETYAANTVTLVDDQLPSSPVTIPYVLAPGSVFPYTDGVSVPGTHTAATFDNTATVNYGGDVQDTATASVVVALLDITKTVPPGRVAVGQDIQYTITVTNLSSGEVTHITLEDSHPLMVFDPPLPASISILGGQQYIATGHITVPSTLTQPAIQNTASVLIDGVVIDEATVNADIQLIELTKHAAPPEVAAGGRVDYTFDVQNLSTMPLDGLVLEDPTILMDTPLSTTIAGGAILHPTGHVFIPSGWDVALPFTNTARVYMNTDVLMDEASAAVDVIETPIGVELLGVYQNNAGDQISVLDDEALLTGTPTTVEFVISNLGGTTLTNLGFQVLVNSAGTPVSVDCQLVTPATLTGVTIPLGGVLPVSCRYTPPAGAANNANITAGVASELQVTVTGTVEGGTEPDTAADSTALNYIDLLLGVTLTITPAEAQPGDTVTYSATITNLGASPVGCGAAVAPASPCHLRPSFSDATLETVLGTDLATIANMVLNPSGQIGDSTTLTEDRVIGASDPTINHTLFIDGGYYVDGLAATLQSYYVVQGQDDATLTITPVNPVSDLGVTLNEVYQLDGDNNHLVLLQTGKPTYVRFTLENLGTADITNLSYTVRVGGDLLDPACQHVQGDLPNPFAPDATVTVICRYSPPVGAANNENLNPRLQVVARGRSGGNNIVGDDAQTIDLVDLLINIQLTVDPTTAMPDDIVAFDVTLSNQGASPIGCDDTVGAGWPCHLELSTGGNAVLNDALATVLDQVGGVVLEPAGEAGDEQTFSGSHTVTDTDESATFTLSVDGGFYDAAFAEDVLGYYTAHDEDTADLTISGGALDLVITAYPNPPVYGSNITYTVTIRNTGTGTVSNLVATWQISALAANADGIMLVSHAANPAAQTTSGTLTLNPNSVDAGGSVGAILAKIEDMTRNYQFTVTVSGDGISGDVTASESLMLAPSNVGTPTPTGTLTATLDPNAVDPQVTKVASGESVQQGGAVMWTITVRNGGTAAMSNVTMKDALPDTLVLGSATSTKGEVVTEGQLLTLGTGAMNPGEVITVTVNTTVASSVAAPAIITNTACAARDGGPQVCVNASVNVGPGVGGLPATGIGGFGGRSWGGLLAVLLAGALMLLMSAEISNRRLLFVGIFVLIALIVLVGAVVMLVSQDDEEETETPVAQVPTATEASTGPTETEEVVPPTEDTSQTVETPIAPNTEEPFVTSPVNTPYVVPEPTGPRTLIIPKLAEQFSAPIPIIDLPIVDRRWDVSGLGFYVGWLEGTTWLDPTWGNTVLAAHVQLGFRNPGPFWGLGELVAGDEIIVMEGDVERKFVVTSSRKVDPDDWTVTAPTDGPTLTLLTCTEWDRSYGVFSQRMVIQAVPVQQVG